MREELRNSSPSEGICNWCRRKPGDIFCDTFPCCFDCIEIMIDRENAIEIKPEWREDKYFDALTPMEWER